jgi:arginyl-tRNA synthetase
MKSALEQLVREAIMAEFGQEISQGVVFSVSVPPRPEMGDYATNVAMVLAKRAGQSPKEVAEKIVSSVRSGAGSKYFEKIEVLGGFINFTLSQEFLFETLNRVATERERYGSSALGQGKKVIVEYFQNNVAKPPHVGHLRSAVIGDSLKRLFSFLGFETVSDTHVGDWGVQFGVVLYAFKTMGDRAVVEQDPIQELNKLYVAMSAKIDAEPEVRELCKQEFVKLEQGDKENRELWQWFVDVSLKDFERYRQLLGLLPFEYNLGESFYEDKMAEVLAELESKGLVQVGKTGEKYVDLESDGLGWCILVKSDGGTTYHLRDFATYKYRRDVIGYWKNVYAVDVRQSHHFVQLFKILEKAGYPAESDSVHVDFGFMGLPEGAISTRKGNVISLETLLGEAESRARAIIEEKNPGLKSKDVVAGQVARAAIKYFDLMHNRQSNITFTWDKALSFEGNTGPYLQYTHARICGIVRKSEDQAAGEVSGQYRLHELEALVIRKLVLFPEVLEAAATEYYPNLLCNYLFELAQIFNRFYEVVPVNGEMNPVARYYRTELCNATAQVIQNGLLLLGIDAPEEM